MASCQSNYTTPKRSELHSILLSFRDYSGYYNYLTFHFTDQDCKRAGKSTGIATTVFMRVKRIKKKQTNKTQEHLTPSHYTVISHIWVYSG